MTTLVVQESGAAPSQSFHWEAEVVVLVVLLLVFLVVVEVEVVLLGSHAVHDDDGSQVVEDLEVLVVLELELELAADQPSHPWAEARPATAAMTETEYFILVVIKKVELL